MVQFTPSTRPLRASADPPRWRPGVPGPTAALAAATVAVPLPSRVPVAGGSPRSPRVRSADRTSGCNRRSRQTSCRGRIFTPGSGSGMPKSTWGSAIWPCDHVRSHVHGTQLNHAVSQSHRKQGGGNQCCQCLHRLSVKRQRSDRGASDRCPGQRRGGFGPLLRRRPRGGPVCPARPDSSARDSSCLRGPHEAPATARGTLRP
jgi:hypothetical protein